jgi:WD40 repeat protein
MSDATPTEEPAATALDRPPEYDAFLSYTHRDRPVAAGIQKGLHQIGRRLGQLRALRVFRDDTNLEVSPNLWHKITEALDSSRFLVVVLSPTAAKSYWVDREVGYWLQHRGRERLLLVLAGGKLEWDADRQRFDPQGSDAALPVLTEPGALLAEPFYIDVSEDAPWDPRAVTLREKISALAAPIHGKPKDELLSDDLREQRRFRRLRAVAIAGLALLTVVAVVAALVAVVQRGRAIEQRNAAIALRLVAEAQSMLAGDRPGNDARAFQELLAAQKLAEMDHRKPDDGSVFDALVARSTTFKVLDTQRPLTYLALSPTGDRFATSGLTGGVRWWKTDTGKQIAQSELTANGVAFSPDGTRLVAATGGSPGDVGMWDTRTGQLLRTFTGLRQAATRVAFSPDGQRIAAGGFDGTAWVWNVETGSRELTLAQSGRVNAVNFSPAAKPGEPLIATGGDDKTVRLWDAVTGKLLRTLTGIEHAVADLAFSPDGRTLASASTDTAVRLWDPDTGDPKGVLNSQGVVLAVAWNPNPATAELASAGTGGEVQLWTFSPGMPMDLPGNVALPGQIGQVQNVAFSADGSRLIAGGADGVVYVWDTNVIEEMRAIVPIAAVAWSIDGQRIAAGGADGEVQLWDPKAPGAIYGQQAEGPPTRLSGQTGTVYSVVFDPLGKLVAAGGGDGTVSLWDRDSGDLLRTLPAGHPAGLYGLAFSKDGRLVASGGDERTVRLWDPRSGDLKRTLSGPTNPVQSVAFSPAEHLVAGGSADGKLYVWDTDTGALRQTVPTPDSVNAVAFSPDGQHIATGGGDNMVRVWDAKSGRPAIGAMKGHTNVVDGVAFSPDGRYLASASHDNTTRLWEAGTGEPIGSPMTGPDQWVSGVAFSPDGQRLVSGSLDGSLRLWPASVSAAQLCAKLTANPSHKQWNEWISPDIDYIPVCQNLRPAPDNG